MGHFGALGARDVLGLKHGGRRGQARAGEAGRRGQAGRGQTKSPRRLTGGSDRGGDLGGDGGRGRGLGHFERMERIHSRRYSGNGAFSEQGRDLRRLVVGFQQHAFRREAQSLRRDFRGLGGGGGGGGGYPFRFQKGSELDEGGGGNGLGFHSFSIYRLPGIPRREPLQPQRQGDNARLPGSRQLPIEKKRPGVSSGLV